MQPLEQIKVEIKHKDKPWHDIDCKSKLRHIKSLGRLLGNSPWDKSLRLKSCMRKNSIINVCAKNIGYLNPNYYRILLNRLIITPEFWIIVNLLKEKKCEDPSQNISPQEWYDYFNTLMNLKYDNNFNVTNIG